MERQLAKEQARTERYRSALSENAPTDYGEVLFL